MRSVINLQNFNTKRNGTKREQSSEVHGLCTVIMAAVSVINNYFLFYLLLYSTSAEGL